MPAARADIIITMLADDNASRALWLDKDSGALAAAAPGTWLIESQYRQSCNGFTS